MITRNVDLVLKVVKLVKMKPLVLNAVLDGSEI